MADLGQAGKFSVDISGGGEYTELMGQTGGTWNRTNDGIDTTNKDSDLDKEVVGGERGWEASVTGYVDGTDTALDFIEQSWEDGTSVPLLFDVNCIQHLGDAVVTQITYEAPKDQPYSYSITFRGDGPCINGSATAFQCAGSHFIVPSITYDGAVEFSYDAWWYATSTGPTGLFSGNPTGSTTGMMSQYRYYSGTTDAYNMTVNATLGDSEWQVPRATYMNTWHHVAIVHDPAGGSSRWKLYVDGTQRATNDETTSFDDSGIKIGYGLTNGFSGKILAPRLWTIALSAAQVAAAMAYLNLPSGTTGLEAQYLRYGATTIYDSSGNDNDATNGSGGSNKVSNGGDYILSGGVPVEV